MLNKDNAYDLFNHFSLDQGCVSGAATGSTDPKKYVEIKLAKKTKKSVIRKLTIMCKLGAVRGLLYLRTVLKRI